jgi:streptomycin 6-kinase
MDTTFRNSLPSEFVRNTVALCGTKGEEWLDRLSDTIDTLQDQWSLTVETPFPNIGYNFVAPATRSDRSQAVVKIGLPLENTEIFAEAKYLRALNGAGAVRLLEEDRERQAVLLERAVPGRTLTSVCENRQMEALEPAIDLLKAILKKPPDDRSDTISLDDWFDGLRRFSEKQFPADYALEALEIYEGYSKNQPERTYYLHGDFHLDNIVSAERSPYVVIDPKGIIGHIGYEIAVFLNNFHWWQDAEPDIHERLKAAVEQFADAFGIDPNELKKWAFAQMVLSAWWIFDEMPDIYSNELALADIWRV